MLLENYEDYLKSLGLSEGTIRIYSGRIGTFIERGAQNDLLGNIDLFIKEYSKGGTKYDPKDHGNTVAALRRLREYIVSPYEESFMIAYDKGYASFVRVDEHVSSYTIADGTITISYDKGHFKSKTVTKKIPKQYYVDLIYMVMKHQYYLSDSNTAIKTTHGVVNSFRYVFGDQYGVNCAFLFDAEKETPVLIQVRDEYKKWLSKYISE